MIRQNIDRAWKFTPKAIEFYAFLETIDRQVDLPHDFTIESDVSADSANDRITGYYDGGVGSYVKELEVLAEWEGKRIVVEFDGAHMCTEVFLNGHLVTKHPYGYTPFHADLTPYVKYGKKNRLVVIVNNTAQRNSRWYTGSGLYRHVDLLSGPKVHLAPWSIYAYTERIDGEDAFVTAEVSVENHTNKNSKQFVKVTMCEENSEKVVASGDMIIYALANSKSSNKVNLIVENPAIWDIESPNLYTIKAQLYDKKTDEDTLYDEKNEEEWANKNITITDTDQTLFGIRTITVDRKNGFKLNGRSIKLKGGCVHHDNGILGSASFYDSEYRKMRLHKENGYNAIRCAHNPPSKDMLEACDRLGILVINEAFDVWSHQKNINDYHLYFDDWWKKDMELFMTRDRNHPCIIMWSTGNEVIERNGLSGGYELAAKLAEYARSLDNTRFITHGLCTPFNGLEDEEMIESFRSHQEGMKKSSKSLQNLGNSYSDRKWPGWSESFAAPLDIMGYNYMENRYEKDGKLYPERIICGTESHPDKIDIIWDKVENNPFVIGDFNWTSWDYIGEAALGYVDYLEPDDKTYDNADIRIKAGYPWRTAFDADFDICGEKRPQLHYRKIVWGSDETYIAVHNPVNWGKVEKKTGWAWTECYNEWTFNGYEGKSTYVDIYSAAKEVELFVNGESKGRKAAGKANRFKAQFQVDYEPGTIVAVSYEDDIEVSSRELKTVGKAASLKITLEKSLLQADGQSLAYALVEIVDEDGNRVPFEDYKVKAKVSGVASLAAFGTGRPVTEENYTVGEFTSYNGKLQAIIRSGYEAGQAELKVSAEGIGQATVIVNVE